MNGSPTARFRFRDILNRGSELMRNDGDALRSVAELTYRPMNRRLAALLNWLDALRTPLEFERFETTARRD